MKSLQHQRKMKKFSFSVLCVQNWRKIPIWLIFFWRYSILITLQSMPVLAFFYAFYFLLLVSQLLEDQGSVLFIFGSPQLLCLVPGTRHKDCLINTGWMKESLEKHSFVTCKYRQSQKYFAVLKHVSLKSNLYSVYTI